MPDGVPLDFPTTNVYTLDTHTGRLSHAIMRLPSPSGSYPTREASSYALTPLNADIHMPALEKATLRIVEELHIRDGETVYFVTKLDPRRPSSHGFVDALDAYIRSAKRQVTVMERLVWQLEAALGEDDRSYEADVDEPEDELEDEVMPDSGYESDDEGIDDFCWGTTHCLPSSYHDEDPRYAPKSEEGEGLVGTVASPSLPSDPSDELVTFDPPPSSVTSTEEGAPSAASATALSDPIQISSSSVSVCTSDDFSAIENRSTLAGNNISPSLPHPESACGDDPISAETLPDNLGPGCPPTEEEPICLACYGMPIRLLWGDESSDESLSDLVDDLLGECDIQFDDLEIDQFPASVDGPVPSPILAADWSLSQALVSMDAGHEAKGKGLAGAGSTSSVESLFSESQDAQTELDGESEELAETVKRRRNDDKAPESDESVEIPLSTLRAARAALPSDESVEIPLSALSPLRVKKRRPRPLRVEKGRPRPPVTGQSASTGPSATVQGETPPPGRRKRRRDDEKEEGEISEYETDPETEPDIPLSQVLASRRRSQSTLGHGPPPAKRRRCTQHGVAEQHRVSSRESRRPRRSWVHRRWEERLRLRHARGSPEGRRGIRIMSTDEELIRRGLRALEGADRRREVRHHGSV